MADPASSRAVAATQLPVRVLRPPRQVRLQLRGGGQRYGGVRHHGQLQGRAREQARTAAVQDLQHLCVAVMRQARHDASCKITLSFIVCLLGLAS